MMQSDWILNLRSNELTTFFRLIALFSNYIYVFIIAMGLWRRPFSHRFHALAFLFPFSAFLNALLKNIFAISRPPLDLHLIPVFDWFGMPSGDVQVSTVVWIILALEFRSLPMRISACLAIILIGFSRVYLGVHSGLDVIVGCGVGALTVLVWERYRCMRLLSHSYYYWVFLGGMAALFILSSLQVPLAPVSVMSLGALIGFGCVRSTERVLKAPMSWFSCIVFFSLLLSLNKMFPMVTSSYFLIVLSIALKQAFLMIALVETLPRLHARLGMRSL